MSRFFEPSFLMANSRQGLTPALGNEIRTALDNDLGGAKIVQRLGEELCRLCLCRLRPTHLACRQHGCDEDFELVVFHGLAPAASRRTWHGFGLEKVGERK